ncbi:MATE family efflux transporter, partial [Gardnerella vaginalis]|nr:MATE family efflux transporter [Gardnerella vaginalis]
MAALAAHQILLQLWNFLALVLDSLAIAAQTLTGSALGTGDVERAKEVCNQTTRFSTGFGVLLAAVFALFAGQIWSLFT